MLVVLVIIYTRWRSNILLFHSLCAPLPPSSSWSGELGVDCGLASGSRCLLSGGRGSRVLLVQGAGAEGGAER